jgi:hypothetical protein
VDLGKLFKHRLFPAPRLRPGASERLRLRLIVAPARLADEPEPRPDPEVLRRARAE